MIVKMTFLHILGPKADIDRVVSEYFTKYEIHLENALSEQKTGKKLKPYCEANPYREWLSKADKYAQSLPCKAPVSGSPATFEEAVNTLQALEAQISAIEKKRMKLEKKREELQKSLRDIEPFLEFDYNICEALKFRFLRCRFGRIARNDYENFKKNTDENPNVIFFKCRSDSQYVWGVHFMPAGLSQEAEAVFSSLHFDPVRLPDPYDETPRQAVRRLKDEIEACYSQISACRGELLQTLAGQRSQILAARETLKLLSTNFDVRKLAACTTEERHPFFLLCGWMPQDQAKAFEREMAKDENLYCILEENAPPGMGQPPTKLKNPPLFQPFELFIRMYGLPAYTEIDPTIFVALTYAFIFGAMFGDVGQGLCLLAGGALLFHYKKMPLAAVISQSGFFSTIFGFLYGSFFGFENLLPSLWLKPSESMITLPLFGKINTVFAAAVVFGLFLILTTLALHLINELKIRREKKFLAKEPRKFSPEILFELFEILLSYFSNILSFLRIGAFAVSHAAMMQVVQMLAGAQSGHSLNWSVILLGNLLVCGMEGLIVGIQVLRLEYYEMFSRFYKGTGRRFIPFGQKKE